MPNRPNPSFDFLSLSDPAILSILAKETLRLTVDEAKKIHHLLKRPPTLAECVLWSIQGSEHCSYKSTRIHLKTLPTDAPNVILGPKEDAGIVEVARDHAGLRYGIVISHESHNHPSQVVPFEGAATGVGGNVRDVSCMGAEVIAIADSLRFGDIHNPKTQRIDQGVVSGIAGYGNPIGVPNITGDVFYDSAYQDNCLVTVVTLGIVREDRIIHSYAPKNAVGYELILVGKPTDHSGFGGASFASVDLNEEETVQNKGAVQEPNAFLGQHLLKANTALFKKLAEKDLIDRVGFKDLGAGGIACASIEIADLSGYGAEVFLENVHTTTSDLPPQVILCAETQERYLWAVPPSLSPLILQHYNEEWQLPHVSRGAKASIIGTIRDDSLYVVNYHGEVLVSANASDITQGILYDRPHTPRKPRVATKTTSQKADKATLLSLLANPNFASQKSIYECYDKQVQGRTVLERGEAAAGVIAPFNSPDYPPEIQNTGIALSVAHNPSYGKIDAYHTAHHAIISSMRKVVSVGAKPAALTDCLCFGNPEKPEQMQTIIDAIRGIKDACESVPLYDYPSFPTPIVSGNVSLYNVSGNTDIPASPIVSCLGVLENVNDVLTPDIKKVGSHLLVLSQNQAVAAEFFSVLDLIRAHSLLACQVVDLGGLALALMTMSFKNNVGFSIPANLDLFAETGGFVLEVDALKLNAVQQVLHDRKLNFTDIGTTISSPTLTFGDMSLHLQEAKTIFMNSLRELRS
ncbi:MAG: phosphoribosylformylglycinamidine synthase II [Legionellales bacterium RIFCSPHIGHO2_12_FULL_42_9]|nr:MAG: phosphoribosylformylglycinamidine synthase II [Legionellales bacterium RIFCSPHIGHO2_12_FULL_42_9]